MSFLKSYWKSLLVAAVILYLSLFKIPSPKIMPPIANADKWVHALMYMGLALMLHWEMAAAHIKGWKHYVWCLLFPIAYGGVIEILQENFFKPRTGDWIDWAADIIGVLLGYMLVWLFLKIKASKK